jgi:hypothetical protein
MDSYDVLYGRPAAGLAARFQRRVEAVLAAGSSGSWSDFLGLAGLKARGDDAYLTAW